MKSTTGEILDQVPEFEEELVEASKDFFQDRDQQRSTEDTIEIPAISLAEKVVEVPVIQTRGKTQQGVNIHIQHVVDTDDAENHIIQEKINQMTKHIDVPRMQIVERTVEGARLQIVEKMDETLAITSRIPAFSGGDPFVKVKSLITELINQLQDTLERLNKNQLAENDELEFGQACDSEHFPTKKGRNLNPESEVFMARIFQIWVSHFWSFRPGSRSRQISDETKRPEQSKQGLLWVRFEAQTKAVDLGGTEEEMRKRIQTAIKQTGEEEVYVTSQERRETWETVMAMEDGRVIEVAVKMKGGMGKKRSRKNNNPWNTPSSESEPEKSNSADETNQHQMQEELQRMVTQAMEQGVILNQFVEVMAAVDEKEWENMLGRYEAGMPKELEEEVLSG